MIASPRAIRSNTVNRLRPEKPCIATIEPISFRLIAISLQLMGKGPRIAKPVDYRSRGARMARRDEGAYCWYATEEQRCQPGCLGRESDRLGHSRALSQQSPAQLTDSPWERDSARSSPTRGRPRTARRVWLCRCAPCSTNGGSRAL